MITLTGLESLIALLGTAALRTLVLAGIAGLGLTLFRVKSTSARLYAWTMVLYAALLMPVLGSMLPPLAVSLPSFLQTTQPIPSELAKAPVSSDSATRRHLAIKKHLPAAASPVVAEETATSPAAAPFPWGAFLVTAYVAVAFALLTRFGVGVSLSRRLLKNSRPIQDSRVSRVLTIGHGEANSLPQVAESDCISVPVTMGVVRPRILLPASWREWDEAKLGAVLAHEMSHIARGDSLTQQLALLYRALFWFNPLAWWLERHLAKLAEQASDEAVLASGADRNDYARMLLGFFETLHASPGRVWWEGVAMAKSGQAEQRLERILAWKGTAMNLRKPVVLAIIALAIPITYFAASVQAADVQQESQATASTPAPAAVPAPAAPPVRGVVAPAPLAAARAMAAQARALAGVVAPRALGFGPSYGVMYPRAYSYAYGFDDDETYAIVSGNSGSMTISGMGDAAEHIERLKKRISGDFIWFERNGTGYVIRDQATIERAKKLFSPQDDLGKQQDELGKQQDVLGKQQDELGQKMEQVKVKVPDLTADLDKLRDKLKQLKDGATQDEVGDLQSQIGDLQEKIGAIQSQAGDQQSKIGEQMEVLGRQQENLGEQQERLGRQQEELAQRANREMKLLFDDAIKNGTAKPEPEVDNPASL